MLDDSPRLAIIVVQEGKEVTLNLSVSDRGFLRINDMLYPMQGSGTFQAIAELCSKYTRETIVKIEHFVNVNYPHFQYFDSLREMNAERNAEYIHAFVLEAVPA